MNLDEVRANKAKRDSGTPEFLARQDLYRAEMKAALEEAMPAASDFDRAAAAWHLAGTVAAFMRVPASDIGDALYWTTVAYAAVTTDLLGWENDELGN